MNPNLSLLSWFRFAPITIVINTINHSEIGVINQFSYLGGPTLWDVNPWIAPGFLGMWYAWYAINLP